MRGREVSEIGEVGTVRSWSGQEGLGGHGRNLDYAAVIMGSHEWVFYVI